MDLDRKAKYMNQKNSLSSTGYVDLGIDLHSLDILCKMVLSKNKLIRRTQLMNIGKYLEILNPKAYVNDPEKQERVNFIRKGIEARLGLNIDDPYMIMKHIDGGIITDGIVDLEVYKDLNNDEANFMNNMISETLQYATFYKSADKMMDICTRLKTGEYGTKGTIVEEYKNHVNDVQNEFRRARNDSHMDMVFSLREGNFEDCVIETYNRVANPKHKLSTGMQGMNELLGGGFESGRVYIYMGLPGEGKSTVILNLMYQIKKYNRDYQCKDPTKRPCIALLTMENSVEETIERLFGLATDREKMTEFDVETVIQMLKKDGELTLTSDNPIDIVIKYMPTNSVDSGYLYTMSDDLEDQGYEVICFFQDYIGRIRSTQHLSDARLEYGAVVDDFKVFAQAKDIPVISVSQLNRDASKKIDEGRQSSKIDLVRLLGRSNTSESMLILNNSDAVFMIAPETLSTGEKYLGIQRVKIRYNAGDQIIAYLPFSPNNGIKLLEDFGMEASYKRTLNSTPTGIGSAPYMMNPINELDSNIQTSKINTSIFSAAVCSSVTDLDVLFSPKKTLVKPMVFLTDPMEFRPESIYA